MTFTLLQGDCLNHITGLGENTIDAIVTDPPYGLEFMGKAWDHGVPGRLYWGLMLAVAKPGAHLLAFGGTRTHHRLMVAIEDAGWEIRDCLMWLYGSGFPKSLNLAGGLGTGLKPAWEPIILARKPLREKNVASNIERWGTGAIQIEDSRIAITDGANLARNNKPGSNGWKNSSGGPNNAAKYGTTGRWPANLLLDEEVAAQHAWSRFFYCAKANKKERDEGLESLVEKPKFSKLNLSNGSGERFDGSPTPQMRNNHPTVKPLALMEYLCNLVTPKNGTILDPFMGSGTTGKAALLNDYHFVGIELNAEYVEIARLRLEYIYENGNSQTQRSENFETPDEVEQQSSLAFRHLGRT